MAFSNDNAVRNADIEKIERGNPNYNKMADTVSYEYKQMLELAFESIEQYASEHKLSAKEKKELEQAQIINARRFYLQARNQENARNGGFFAKRDIETNNREIRALNNLYSQKVSAGLDKHLAEVNSIMSQKMQSQQQTSKKTNKKKSA